MASSPSNVSSALCTAVADPVPQTVIDGAVTIVPASDVQAQFTKPFTGVAAHPLSSVIVKL